MPYYQLYHMNSISGHIDRRETLHAGDDVATVHMLQGQRFTVPVELWREGNKIARQDGPPNPFRSHATRPAKCAPAPVEGHGQIERAISRAED